MVEKAPTQKMMLELLGQSLFEVWEELCSTIEKNMTWKNHGMLVEKNGLTSISIVEVGKHFVVYMQNEIVSVS